MYRIMPGILFTLTMLFFNITGIAENRPTTVKSFPSQDSVRLLFDEVVKASGLPAVVATAVDKTGQMVRYTYGKAVWNENERVSENHIFRIYSMTKLVTSIAVLQLVENELVGLDDDLSSLMPEMAAIPILSDGELRMGENPVTLRALLTHTSGFGYVTTDRQLDEFDVSKWNFRDLPRRFESGAQFLYGTSLNWVGRIVEKISGVNLETYCREHITGPLEMNRTWFNVPDSLKSFIVSRGQLENGEMKELPDRIPEKVVTDFNGGGGLFSSPADFTKLLYCLLNGGSFGETVLLKKETVQQMIQNQIGDIVIDIEHAAFKEHCCDFRGLLSKTTKWGFGWAIDNEDKLYGRKAGTVFWGGSMNTYFYIDFKAGIAAGIYAQYYPFNHPATLNLFGKFSEIIYSDYKKQ